MIDKLRVTRVEVFEFKFTTRDWGGDPKVPTGIYNPGTVREARSKGVRIHTDQGVSGTYIGGNDVEYAGIPAFIPNVIGKNPLQREDIYYDAKHALRQHARMGLGVVDCALWDLAGRYYDVPVYELLGGTPGGCPHTPAPHWETATRTGSVHRKPTPTSPSSATNWVIEPTRSTVGRTRQSKNISSSFTPWANAWPERCFSCSIRSAP